MKKIVLTVLLAATALCMHAQKVTFLSEGFKFGVKAHLGLGETDEVLQTQTDTITSIDLSGLGISDISDVFYLPNVEKLNLSLNEIVDVEPLASLEHLQYVNLKSNQLESVNALAFALADSMLVNVADNYISEFTYLFSTSICQFVFEGMGAQKVKDEPFWDVNTFYADVDENDKPFLMYRGNSNRADLNFEYGGQQTPIVMDSYSHSIELSSLPTETTAVAVIHGEENVTTYLVPPTNYNAVAGETVTMETGLPEDYRIEYAIADYGVVDIDGNKMRYMPSGNNLNDIVHFCYYQGNTLKGFSRYYLNIDMIIGDVNGNGDIDIGDAVSIVNYLVGKESETFVKAAADTNKNGQIDIGDAVTIVNFLVGKTAALSRQLDTDGDEREPQ